MCYYIKISDVRQSSPRSMQPGRWAGEPAAVPKHGHAQAHLHASQVCKEHPEDHTVHEDGVCC